MKMVQIWVDFPNTNGMVLSHKIDLHKCVRWVQLIKKVDQEFIKTDLPINAANNNVSP